MGSRGHMAGPPLVGGEPPDVRKAAEAKIRLVEHQAENRGRGFDRTCRLGHNLWWLAGAKHTVYGCAETREKEQK